MRAQLDLACWRRLLSNFVALEVYPVTQIDDSTVHVRMFAPAAGVAEDAATGSAAAALAGWLVRRTRPRERDAGPCCRVNQWAAQAASKWKPMFATAQCKPSASAARR